MNTRAMYQSHLARMPGASTRGGRACGPGRESLCRQAWRRRLQARL